jgi:hypothetical protein
MCTDSSAPGLEGSPARARCIPGSSLPKADAGPMGALSLARKGRRERSNAWHGARLRALLCLHYLTQHTRLCPVKLCAHARTLTIPYIASLPTGRAERSTLSGQAQRCPWQRVAHGSPRYALCDLEPSPVAGRITWLCDADIRRPHGAGAAPQSSNRRTEHDGLCPSGRTSHMGKPEPTLRIALTQHFRALIGPSLRIYAGQQAAPNLRAPWCASNTAPRC